MFAPTLVRAFRQPMGGDAAAIPWWLTGGIPAANCLAAYSPKGAASQAASYINLANPGTYDAAPGTAPSWASATGWTFVAASLQYLTTGITPATGCSIVARVASLVGGTTVAGAYDGTTRFHLEPQPIRYGIGSGLLTVGPNITAGVIAICGISGFRNGVSDTAGGSTARPTTFAWTIGARARSASTRDTYFAGAILALAYYNIDISAYVAVLSTAMAAL